MIVIVSSFLLSLYGAISNAFDLNKNLKITILAVTAILQFVPAFFSIYFSYKSMVENRMGKTKYIVNSLIRNVTGDQYESKIPFLKNNWFLSKFIYCDPFSYRLQKGYNATLFHIKKSETNELKGLFKELVVRRVFSKMSKPVFERINGLFPKDWNEEDLMKMFSIIKRELVKDNSERGEMYSMKDEIRRGDRVGEIFISDLLNLEFTLLNSACKIPKMGRIKPKLSYLLTGPRVKSLSFLSLFRKFYESGVADLKHMEGLKSAVSEIINESDGIEPHVNEFLGKFVSVCEGKWEVFEQEEYSLQNHISEDILEGFISVMEEFSSSPLNKIDAKEKLNETMSFLQFEDIIKGGVSRHYFDREDMESYFDLLCGTSYKRIMLKELRNSSINYIRNGERYRTQKLVVLLTILKCLMETKSRWRMILDKFECFDSLSKRGSSFYEEWNIKARNGHIKVKTNKFSPGSFKILCKTGSCEIENEVVILKSDFETKLVMEFLDRLSTCYLSGEDSYMTCNFEQEGLVSYLHCISYSEFIGLIKNIKGFEFSIINLRGIYYAGGYKLNGFCTQTEIMLKYLSRGLWGSKGIKYLNYALNKKFQVRKPDDAPNKLWKHYLCDINSVVKIVEGESKGVIKMLSDVGNSRVGDFVINKFKENDLNPLLLKPNEDEFENYLLTEGCEELESHSEVLKRLNMECSGVESELSGLNRKIEDKIKEFNSISDNEAGKIRSKTNSEIKAIETSITDLQNEIKSKTYRDILKMSFEREMDLKYGVGTSKDKGNSNWIKAEVKRVLNGEGSSVKFKGSVKNMCYGQAKMEEMKILKNSGSSTRGPFKKEDQELKNFIEEIENRIFGVGYLDRKKMEIEQKKKEAEEENKRLNELKLKNMEEVHKASGLEERKHFLGNLQNTRKKIKSKVCKTRFSLNDSSKNTYSILGEIKEEQLNIMLHDSKILTMAGPRMMKLNKTEDSVIPEELPVIPQNESKKDKKERLKMEGKMKRKIKKEAQKDKEGLYGWNPVFKLRGLEYNNYKEPFVKMTDKPKTKCRMEGFTVLTANRRGEENKEVKIKEFKEIRIDKTIIIPVEEIYNDCILLKRFLENKGEGKEVSCPLFLEKIKKKTLECGLNQSSIKRMYSEILEAIGIKYNRSFFKNPVRRSLKGYGTGVSQKISEIYSDMSKNLKKFSN